MVNFKFVKSQYRQILIPLVILIIVSLIMLIPSFIPKHMGDYTDFIIYDSGLSSSTKWGGMTYLSYIYLGVPGILIMVIFSIILNHLLIAKEIKEGYMASWLTSPMSRKTIINSKLFVVLTGLGTALITSMIVQMIFYPIIFPEFSAEAFGKIVLANVDFMLLIFLFVSINWVIVNFFNKGSHSLAIASGILAFFATMAVLNLLRIALPALEIAKYFTITSLFNFPFTFGEIPELPEISMFAAGNHLTLYAPLIKGVDALDFAWQMPLMAALLPGFFILGNTLLIKKDLHL